MKNYLLLLVLLLAGCAKKTHITNSADLYNKVSRTNDTSSLKEILKVDKTQTFTIKYLDTIVTIAGKTLNGYLRKPILNQDTSAHFENDDVAVVLSVDKNGFASFAAKPKLKQIPIKVLERTEIYNDISTKESAQTQGTTSTDEIAILKEKHSEKQITRDISPWFNAILIAAIVVVFVLMIRKLNLLKLL